MKIKTIKYCVAIGLVALAAANVVRAQISYDGTALNYSQNFNSLGTSTATWTDNSTLSGWYVASNNVAPGTFSLAASTGGNSTGNAYNLGVAGANPATDRALGWLTTSSTGTGYIGLQLQNDSGQNYIGTVTFDFTYEQWSARNTTSDPLFVDYKANLASTGNQLTSAGWTQIDSIASPNLSNSGGAIDGNAPGNFVDVLETITFTEVTPWISGDYLWFRTRDTRISGNNDMNAIDDASVSIAPVPEPSSGMLLVIGMLGAVTLWRRHERMK